MSNDIIKVKVHCEKCGKFNNITIDKDDVDSLEKKMGLYAIAIDHGTHIIKIWLDKAFKIRSTEITDKYSKDRAYDFFENF